MTVQILGHGENEDIPRGQNVSQGETVLAGMVDRIEAIGCIAAEIMLSIPKCRPKTLRYILSERDAPIRIVPALRMKSVQVAAIPCIELQRCTAPQAERVMGYFRRKPFMRALADTVFIPFAVTRAAAGIDTGFAKIYARRRVTELGPFRNPNVIIVVR